MPAQTACVTDYPPVKQLNMDFSGNQNRGSGLNNNSNSNMNMNPNLNDSNDLSSANDQQQELFLRRLAATRAANMNMNMNMGMGQDNAAGTGSFAGFGSRFQGPSGMNMNAMNAMNPMSMNAMNMNMNMNAANQQSGPSMFGQAGIAMQNQLGAAAGGPSGTSTSGGGGAGGSRSSASGTGGGAGSGSGSNPTDREDELLLQLLLARRRRQELSDQSDNRPGTGSNFSDELLRLRQAGNAASASSMATAAMFEEHQQNQLLQMQQQQQQQRAANMNMAGGQAGFFSQAMNMQPGMMMQDHQGVGGVNNAPSFLSASAGFNMNANNSNAFAGSPGLRRSTFDDYLLQNQQPHPQEAIRSGMSADQQRIELSPARFRSLQQHEQGPSFLDSMGLTAPNLNSRNFQDLNSMKGELGKVVDTSSSSMEPPTKKKRLHKKKPSDMPRRPLSAYNLFFSEERERILKEIDGDTAGDSTKKEESKTDTNTAADEGSSSKAEGDESNSSSSKKPQALLRPLLPSEKKRRPHRKTHGKISFRMLAQMVGQRWKALPEERRKYYQDLAKEDMKRQKQAMEDYYQKQSEKVKGPKVTTDKSSSATKGGANTDEVSGKEEVKASDNDKC